MKVDPSMLVLSRRQGQRINFPNLDISVQVLSCKGPVVRLGVEAPPEVRVLREELTATGVVQPAMNKAQEMLDKLSSAKPAAPTAAGGASRLRRCWWRTIPTRRL